MISPPKLRAMLAPVVAATCLAGCGSAPPASRHLLPMPSVPSATIETASALRLADVRLPAYHSEAAIAYLAADGTVVVDAGEQWAEEPQQAITRALGRALRAASGATVIYEPWPVGYEAAATVSVSVHRMIAAPAGRVELIGQLLILTPEQVLKVREFELDAPVAGGAVGQPVAPAVLDAYARVLGALAERIAAAIAEP